MVTLYSVYIYISIYGNVSNTEDKSLTRYTCQLCTYGNVGILCISEYVSNTEEREREREREKLSVWLKEWCIIVHVLSFVV